MGVSLLAVRFVEVVQARQTGRMARLGRDPHSAVVWTEGTQGKNVYLKGRASLVEDEALLAMHRRRSAVYRARGLDSGAFGRGRP
jgi:hypothetical protein